MKENEVAALLRYRLKRAQEALLDARLLADAGRWNSCVNRLYYACFYAVSALLLQRGLLSTKHSGIRSFTSRLEAGAPSASVVVGTPYASPTSRLEAGVPSMMCSHGTRA